jgi:hypothetical protein
MCDSTVFPARRAKFEKPSGRGKKRRIDLFRSIKIADIHEPPRREVAALAARRKLKVRDQ